MPALQRIRDCDDAIVAQIRRYERAIRAIDARLAAGAPYHGDVEEHGRLQAHITRLMEWRVQTRSAMHAYMLGARPAQESV